MLRLRLLFIFMIIFPFNLTFCGIITLASTKVTLLEKLFASNKHELLCSWPADQSSSVMLFSKNESQSSFNEIVDIVDIANGKQRCKVFPSYLPYGMQCRCIDQGLAGCNVTTTPGSTDVVEWKCAISFNESLHFSNVSQIRSQDDISSETKKSILDTKQGIIYTKENKPVSLNCSNGISVYSMRELHNVNWYIKNGVEETHLTENQLIINHNGESVLYASFTRGENGSIVYCKHAAQTIAQWTIFVLYPTAVKSFYINDMYEEKQVTLVETDNGTIHCYGEGNPEPTLTLIKYCAENQSNETLYNVNSAHLRYEISSVSSHHSGEYACVASNRYGEELRTLHLIIKQLTEIANIMQASLVTRNERSANLRWILYDDALFHVVKKKTCYVLYKSSKEKEWINVISDINMKLTQTSLTLDLQLTNLRPDTQYEAQLIANLPTGNKSIAPSFTFMTLSFSKSTGIDVVVVPIVCTVLIICMIGVLLRVCMKGSLRNKAHEEIDNIGMNALMSLSTINAVGNAPAFILSDDVDHYDCIDIDRTYSCINPHDDHNGHLESAPSQNIGGTNARDKICVKTQTANTVAYHFLDRTENLAEQQYNSMGDVVEGDMEEYITGCCHSDSTDTDSIISDTCLQYLTVIGSESIPQESVLTSAYDDVANTPRPPRS